MAVMGPYNFPGHLPNGHIIPALLAGNSVVFKPSEFTPGVGEAMARAWECAGLPAGVLNLVQGGREVGAALLEAPELAGVLFTGSAATGAHIHRRFAGRPEVILALEMGGNNPLIVWEPAEPLAAANLIVHSAFLTTGQRCSCARRLILPEGAFGDAVLARLLELAESLAQGAWSADPAPFMGPLVREQAAVRAAAAAGALSGRALTPLMRDGAFLGPHVLDMGAAPPAPDEEIFAPVLQVFRARDFDAALVRANATRFGLAGGLISEDAALWERTQRELRAGVLNWNRPTTGASSSLPFGGPGLSGNGRPSAYYAADYCAWPMAMQTAPEAVAIPAPGLPQPA
jgi:succinylglutamic semialdehyde dehydrogenase